MKLSSSVLTCYLILTTYRSASAAEPTDKPSAAEAQAAAAKWLDGLGEKGLNLDEKITDRGGFVATHGPSAIGRITKFELQQDGYWVSLTFKGELTADTSRKTLQEAFWYAALDRIPTPGLDLPSWEVRPRTPTSSIREGVEVLAYGDNKIKVRVRTGLFALSGRDPSILVPADAPAPPDSYFQIRRKFPLGLTLEAPVRFK